MIYICKTINEAKQALKSSKNASDVIVCSDKILKWIRENYENIKLENDKNNKFYVLWQIGPITGNPNREGEVDTKLEAQKWVDEGIANGKNRCWHEHSKDHENT